MTLNDLGYNCDLNKFVKEGFSPGRVMQEHKERYIVSTGEEEYECEVTGNLRFTASSRADFPAVGDWVSLNTYEKGLGIIHNVLPRKTVLERQTVGKFGEKQIISSNIDAALVIQSIDNNFNINRLERYLTICYAASIEPILLISKIDLANQDEISSALEAPVLKQKKIKIIPMSNTSLEGFDDVRSILKKGKTYCVIGSSGVGKSTLINNLLKRDVIRTGTISESTNKGRHITSHRELFVLDNGAIIIDTPGMKELGVIEDQDGIRNTFEDIYNISRNCKFNDCTHTKESGCAVIEAVEKGIINEKSLENFRKIEREQKRFQVTIAEKHKKEMETGRLYKLILKEKRKSKF